MKEFPDLSNEDAEDVAMRIWEVLPLLLVRETLNNYAKDNNDLTMFLTSLPTVDNPDQAILLLRNEHPRLRRPANRRKMQIIKMYLTYLPKNIEKNNPSQQQNDHLGKSGKLEHPLKKMARRRVQRRKLGRIKKQMEKEKNRDTNQDNTKDQSF